MLNEYTCVLTVSEVMKILKIGRNNMYQLLGTKKIKTFGKPMRILKEDLIEYINKERNG